MSYVRFLAAHPLFLSYAFGLNIFTSLGQTYYLALYNADISAALSLSQGELAGLYGTATILGSVGTLLIGRFLDVLDLRVFTALATIAVATGCWLLGGANTLFAFFAAIFFLRLAGQSLWGMCSQVSVGRYFDKDRGKAAALANVGGALGSTIFPVLGAWLLASYGWRDIWTVTGWIVLAGILPLTMIQLWGHGKRHTVYQATLVKRATSPTLGDVQQWRLSDAFKDVRFWLFQPAMIVVPSVVFTLQFHQLYLIESKGWEVSSFVSAYGFYAVASLVAGFVGGSLIDRFGSRRMVNASVFPIIPAMLILMFVDHELSIFPVMALLGMALGLCILLYVTLWAETYGTQFMGAIRSFNAFMNAITVSIVMVVVGWAIDAGTSVAVMCLGAIGMAVLAMVFFSLAPRSAPKVQPA